MNNYKVSLAAVNVPEEAYDGMLLALRAGKIGQTDIIEDFEKAIAEFVHSSYCIAISNGTMADAVAVAAMKAYLPRPIRRVIVPALTFIAQPNSVRYNNLDVDFVDVTEDWLMDLSTLEDQTPDFIVFATDLMGRQATGFFDIEDACESFGSQFDGDFAGTFGGMGTYSFFPSHTISTGEGGAIVTDDPELDKLCRSIRAHGSGSSDPMDKFHFPRFGFNARITSLQCVLGIALMKHLLEYINRRRTNFYTMMERLGGFEERAFEDIVPHAYPVEFDSEGSRDDAMRNLLQAGIECRKFFSCIPKEEPIFMRPGNWPVAEHIAHTHLYVPCHQNMTHNDAVYVCDQVFLQKGRLDKLVQDHGDRAQSEG